jgi:hypothetical protein
MACREGEGLGPSAAIQANGSGRPLRHEAPHRAACEPAQTPHERDRAPAHRCRKLASHLLVPVLAASCLTGCAQTPPPAQPSQPLVSERPPTSVDKQALPTSPSPSPDFVVHGSDTAGDLIDMAVNVAAPIPADAAGLDPEALSECGDSDARAYAVRLAATVTVVSGLPARAVVDNFNYIEYGTRTNGEYAETVVSDPTGNQSCAGSEDLGLLQPHVPTHMSAWLILDEAISPRTPVPTRAALAQALIMASPSIATLPSGPMTVRVTGRLVVHCGGAGIVSLLGARPPNC